MHLQKRGLGWCMYCVRRSLHSFGKIISVCRRNNPSLVLVTHLLFRGFVLYLPDPLCCTYRSQDARLPSSEMHMKPTSVINDDPWLSYSHGSYCVLYAFLPHSSFACHVAHFVETCLTRDLLCKLLLCFVDRSRSIFPHRAAAANYSSNPSFDVS